MSPDALNLRQLETFVRVAELGSFSKAAIVLGIAQPALSRQVRQLEISLRSVLLERTGRGVVLTEAGRRLLEHGTAILQQVARAREAVAATRDEPSGRLVVGLPPSFGRQLTVPLVEWFAAELPKARLAIVEGLSAHIVEWIASGRVDVGVVLNPEARDAIDTEPLLSEPLCLVSRASRSRGPLPFAELSRYPLVIPERSHAVRRTLEAQAALAGIKLDVAWEVSSVAAILALVRAGQGHAVLSPSALASEDAGHALVARPIVDPALTSTVCLASAASKRPTPLQRQVARRLRELLTVRPA